MRVLFVNQYFPPDVSATAYLLGELAEDISAGHEVLVLAGLPSYNPEAGSFRPKGPQVVRAWSTSFRRESFGGRLINYGTYLASSAGRALTLPRPDVVVAMTDPPIVGLIGLLAARYYRAPFVYVCHDIFPDVAVALGHIRNAAAISAWRQLNRTLRRKADRIVAIGRDMVELLLGEGTDPARIAFISNWAESLTLDPDDLARTRRQMGWENRFVLMHAGNMGLAQNLGIVMEAAHQVQDVTDLLFVFVGDGAARPVLERQARSLDLHNVAFLPYRPRSEVQDLIAAADLHLISLAPGLWGRVVPSKMYGIMAAGRPFIAAVEPESEPALVIEEQQCGVRVDPDDPHQLVSAILGMMDAPLDEMGRRGREAFERLYDRPLSTAKYRRLLEEVGAGH
jgi:colanic acid biosynthesis glycosyl transferase WcaI